MNEQKLQNFKIGYLHQFSTFIHQFYM